MYKASEYGHSQVVELLLSKGAKVDWKDEVNTYNNVANLCSTAWEDQSATLSSKSSPMV